MDLRIPENKYCLEIVLNQGFAGARKAKPSSLRQCAGYMDTPTPMGTWFPKSTQTHWVRGCSAVPCPMGHCTQWGNVSAEVEKMLDTRVPNG